MTPTIRLARYEDANAIAHVHVESWKSIYKGIVPGAFLASLKLEDRVEMWRRALSEGGSFVFVAENRGDLAGFLAGGPAREPIENYGAELYAIYLLNAYQGQGIGRALVSRFGAELSRQGCSGMFVWVLERNPAVSFYSGLGAIRIGQKQIEIGGAHLEELCLGWQSIDSLIKNM